MNVHNSSERTLDKWMPWLLGLATVWLLGRGLRKTFWSLFGMAWALYWVFGRH
ncbi:hypothetical protein [Oleiagrimonas sp. C23AA]|uniref:hypothetical protein n=1 Tax=Oleiagrimonas sp. C23AA TaxID=2719047 RepID=UPI0014208107|nr:hypothetical protein [Oleiagrimonas sp. C23AA]NII09102.1 hypothetical protein [Oleiagrimonas sp. C23AA]